MGGQLIGNQQVKGSVARLVYPKINAIHLSISLPQRKLLPFSITVKAAKGKIRTPYTLID
jgi:hypothetical protein